MYTFPMMYWYCYIADISVHIQNLKLFDVFGNNYVHVNNY